MAAVIIGASLLKAPTLLNGMAGAYHDDGVYLTTARALAEHGEYVIASLPEPLVQTKYPILFPVTLAAVWSAFPSFPENLLALRLVPWLALWAWLYVVWVLVAREFGRREAAWWVVLVTVASPSTLYFGSNLMSETLFAFFGTLAVLLLVRARKSERTTSGKLVLLLAVVCGLAFHTRTIAMTLLPAAAVVFLMRRELGRLVVFGVVWCLVCLPWVLWQRLHPAPGDPLLAYYTKANYSGWNLLTGGDLSLLANVAMTNLVHFFLSPVLLWQLPLFPGAAIITTAAFMGLIALAVWSLRTDTGPIGAWVLSTLGILLFWMWPPSRFLLPVLPMGLMLFILPWRHSTSTRVIWLGRSIAVLLIVSGLYWSVTDLRAELASPAPGSRQERERDVRTSVKWVAERAPADAVLAGNLDPVYWLYTGRQAVRSFSADPYRLFYAPNAPEGAVGDEETLRAILARHGVTHLVVEDLPLFSETRPFLAQVAALKGRWPELLTEQWRSPAGVVAIYRVNLRSEAELAH